MDAGWFRSSLCGVACLCMVIAVIECAVDSEENPGGLRLVCGAAVAASVTGIAVEALNLLL